MVRNDYGVILFHSTQSAIKAERALAKSGLDARLIPTPRHLSSDCGSALRFPWSEVEEVCQLLTEAGVDIAGLYHLGNSRSKEIPVDAIHSGEDIVVTE
ncbi:MAG: DUF3343 domain-containing protein [Chloroflexi bacterium]|nr:DUF3343 domain-containing protein [Chloroflexota bacterium]